LSDLREHPWVQDVSDERGTGQGVWIYLKPGFIVHDDCHTIHEQTVKECLRAFSCVSQDPTDYLLEDSAKTLIAASGAVSRIAARDALDASASALAVAAVVVAVDAERLTPVPFAWVHDAVADATRERFDLDRAYASGLLTVEQHAVKRDAVRVRVRSAVAYANDGDAAAVVVAFPDVAMHDATLSDCGVPFVRVAHPTADGVCGFVAGPAFRTRLPFADVAAAADYVANRPDVIRLPGERVAPSGSGRVARPAVSLPTIAGA
jgi:hypothetical protein